MEGNHAPDGKEIQEQKDYSEKTAELIDEEVSSFVEEGYKKAEEIIDQQKSVLEKVVSELLEKETLEQEEFEDLVGKKKGKEDKETGNQ